MAPIKMLNSPYPAPNVSEDRKMKTRHDGHRLSITLPTDAFACLDYLAEQRRFGTSAPDVASFLILESIKEFMALGWLPAGSMGSHEAQDRTAATADRASAATARAEARNGDRRTQRVRRRPSAKTE